ncbi:carboxypeptidase regulatory-like domain-containing protein [Acidicapsa dinghuensis]|uniref:Carboxypeptidase regulatory-like domain-containing protein n=1 Tax=Acidicapsa dinghuensis TaxID=2218256 RepID=A0ABW1EH48_9BACT|nr:carboxypeptidase regulatory-like domain-containing protein [Acidicapsa dinghuensis]
MRSLRSIALFVQILLMAGTCIGVGYAEPAATGTVHGTVTDPTGALIPTATIVISNTDGFSKTVPVKADGTYEITNLVPGRYALAITAEGFADASKQDVLVYGGKSALVNVVMQLPVEKQEVQVDANAVGVDTTPDNNASAIVIKGKDLDALSDDPDELQNELTALAGPSAGPSGGQIYIDGFTGGQLPPKSSIREIRVNQNPFSSQYDKLGYGRIEILTKPGTDKFHGMVMINGNDSAFNSLNPFVTNEPPYYSTFMNGFASGSLNKNASWFVNVFRRDNQSNSIVNAELLDASGSQYNFTQAYTNPQSRLDVSPRFDFQLGKNNTLSVRYMFDRQKETNDGVSQFSLASQAYNLTNYENTLQLSDTQILSPNMINETRFQYTRDRDLEAAQNSDPTVTVQGAFTSGGNTIGTVRDNQDRYELQNYTTDIVGRHSINFGVRLRLTRDSNYSTSGFNGTYIYSSLADYAANTPSQYTVTAGNPGAVVNLFDAGLFYQDDFKIKPNLTFSYGLRYEAQNRISDHSDWGPRLSFAWAPPTKNGKPAKTVIRGGYGWFFDRFGSTYVLDAIRQNGINQQQYVIQNPDFYENAPSTSELAASNTVAPTIYEVAPHLKAAVNMQAAIGVEQQIGKIATISATYINSRGVHQYLSDNVNAYLPETYDAATGTGTRPNGINENIYQFQSGGVYNQNQIILNYSVRAKRVSLFGFYLTNFAKADTSGATYFPSNQFDPGADYGRSNFDVRSRFLLGGNLSAPYGVSFSPFLVADSGQPFNIVLGQDLNGDNQFNDRPAFATASSTDTVTTSYGTFDLDPAWNAQRIPYNYGNGPAQLSMNMRVSKSFGIGPRVTSGSGASSGGPGGPGGGGPPPGGGGPGGGGPGGGLGPGGLSRSGGPPRLDQALPRRYSLNFAAMTRNVFNNVNLGQPVNVLGSTLFGKSNSLAGGFFSSPASNRSIDLQMSFNF